MSKTHLIAIAASTLLAWFSPDIATWQAERLKREALARPLPPPIEHGSYSKSVYDPVTVKLHASARDFMEIGEALAALWWFIPVVAFLFPFFTRALDARISGNSPTGDSPLPVTNEADPAHAREMAKLDKLIELERLRSGTPAKPGEPTTDGAAAPPK
jgi:hypothetical protein